MTLQLTLGICLLVISPSLSLVRSEETSHLVVKREAVSDAKPEAEAEAIPESEAEESFDQKIESRVSQGHPTHHGLFHPGVGPPGNSLQRGIHPQLIRGGHIAPHPQLVLGNGHNQLGAHGGVHPQLGFGPVHPLLGHGAPHPQLGGHGALHPQLGGHGALHPHFGHRGGYPPLGHANGHPALHGLHPIPPQATNGLGVAGKGNAGQFGDLAHNFHHNGNIPKTAEVKQAHPNDHSVVQVSSRGLGFEFNYGVGGAHQGNHQLTHFQHIHGTPNLRLPKRVHHPHQARHLHPQHPLPNHQHPLPPHPHPPFTDQHHADHEDDEYYEEDEELYNDDRVLTTGYGFNNNHNKKIHVHPHGDNHLLRGRSNHLREPLYNSIVTSHPNIAGHPGFLGNHPALGLNHHPNLARNRAGLVPLAHRSPGNAFPLHNPHGNAGVLHRPPPHLSGLNPGFFGHTGRPNLHPAIRPI